MASTGVGRYVGVPRLVNRAAGGTSAYLRAVNGIQERALFDYDFATYSAPPPSTGGGAVAFTTTSVVDDFNRANAALTASGNWAANILGDGLPSNRVVSNATQSDVSGASSNYWSAATFGNDNDVYITTTLSFPGGLELYGRVNNPTNAATVTAYLVFFDAGAFTGNGGFFIQTFGPGTGVGYNTINSWQQALVAGDKIGLRCLGSTISCYHANTGGGAWTLVGSVTNSTFTTGGRIGFGNFDTTAVLEDFGGGTVPTTPATIFTPADQVHVMSQGVRRASSF